LTFDRYTAGLTPDLSIMDLLDAQPEFNKSPWDYLDLLVGDERIRVLSAEIGGSAAAPPGTLLDDRLSIACGEGVLRPLRLQRAGRAAMDTAALLRGFALPPGTVLPCPATN